VSVEDRVLLLALRGRDAPVIAQVLSREGHVCVACSSGGSLADALAQGAGTAVVTEESLSETDRPALVQWLQSQPAWSDFPFVLLATKRSGRRPPEALKTLEQLGNVIVLERPIHGETLASAVASALRGRRRQYEARARLQDLEAAEERLRQLNVTLETRIQIRTSELSRVNNQLMQEVAERERAQAALVQSQKMEAVGQLTGGIAHDFNNLLTVIGGNLELIQRRATDAKSASLAGFALQASDRAAKLTRQLLAFSRTQRLTLKPVDINRLVSGMSDLLARTIGPEFRIEMDLDTCGPWAMGDANQVELAILNLAINARDAMPAGGLLRISTAISQEPKANLAPGTYAVVRVADTGSGIPPHLLAKVFDPFFTTKPVGKGTGLGLSQVYGIAQQSGGTVQIESSENVGSVVEIWLPAAGAQTEQEASLEAALKEPLDSGERILVVDDDPGVRRFIAESLELLGYAVLEAADGREGLARLNGEIPSLMIVDFAMPGMNGVEVAIEARSRSPDLPIILATGHADMEAVQQVIDPDRVLRKPFQIEELARAVRAALAA
jgi:signal transduction histidine kinase